MLGKESGKNRFVELTTARTDVGIDEGAGGSIIAQNEIVTIVCHVEMTIGAKDQP